MDVTQDSEPTFTLKVSLREMQMLIVAADMLGTITDNSPSYPLPFGIQGAYDSLYSDLISDAGLTVAFADVVQALELEPRPVDEA